MLSHFKEEKGNFEYNLEILEKDDSKQEEVFETVKKIIDADGLGNDCKVKFLHY